ncbi:hypothetical protein P7C73_g1304, partial [Tremellales sp. Uapishka_1]
MSDPNFPPNLDIRPLLVDQDVNGDSWKQKEGIAKYGIAGRIWEAGQPLLEYFTPGGNFNPSCSLFTKGPHRLIELGSGQSLPTLHLASHLSRDDLVVLTDLPSVIPLCEQSIEIWERGRESHAEVIARPAAWGEDTSSLRELGPFTHVLLCDLLMVDKSRTLALEESFFDSLSLYFQLVPVTGAEWEARVYICRRWKVTKDWSIPDKRIVMNGSKEVITGRSFGLVDQMFGSLEWEV